MGFKFWYVSIFGIGIWLKYKVVLIWIFKESLSFIWNNISFYSFKIVLNSYSLNNLIFIVSGRNVKYIMKWLYVIYVLEMFYYFYGINVILL